MLKTMAVAANLPDGNRYTNHSARKHLVQKLRGHDVPPTEIMAITGHKNVQSILNYSSVTEKQLQTCSAILSTSTKAQSKSEHTISKTNTTCTATLTSQTNPVSVTIPEYTLNSDIMFPTHHTTSTVNTEFNVSTARLLTSQFYGATFNIQNFNVINSSSTGSLTDLNK
ncbi:hypothetical protein DPMN_139457 [Dreissena polymorpha]|uniref:Tyr recombinase domain-containing protein n=1 Tax=Dreissena polymorpha TaxID=45954 RepID=A0A9D4JGJ0_DREPO|nr:hypothetical protein DPMN_139457 [Dreissena polymorpha]